MTDQTFDIDILGQQTLLRIYTHLALIYALPSEPEELRTLITAKLTAGLEKLAAGFPWVAGQVISEGATDGSSGIFKIAPYSRIPDLHVKNLTNDESYTMDIFRERGFPMSMLGEDIIAPRNTLPTPDDPAEFPVFIIQATFIKGGLILNFLGEHNCMDMMGQGQVIALLDKACKEVEFSPEDVNSGNLPRADVIPLLEESVEKLKEEISGPHQAVHPSAPTETPPAPPKASWANFSFPGQALAELKDVATKSLPENSVAFVSTDDAVSAFIWQSVSRARLPRLPTDAKTTFARAIDVRRFLDVPETYTGVCQNMTFHTLDVKDVVSLPAGHLAANLRSAIKKEKLVRSTRVLATCLANTPDKNSVSVSASVDTSKDLMLSSWTKVKAHDFDFGLGIGRPEAARRPRFMPYEGLSYLMPKTDDGEITYALSLRDEDLERLRADGQWIKYAKYIG